MSRHLVLVGGGHAHMVTLSNIGALTAAGHHVTVIQPSAHHYYSGMGPGMLGGTYRPEAIRFATRRIVVKQGGHFVQDRVAVVDPHRRSVLTDQGRHLTYDVLSFNVGSDVPETLSSGGSRVVTVKPIAGLVAARRRILALAARQRIHIAIVGGGPSAAEVAGNLLQLTTRHGFKPPLVTIFSARRLMARHPDAVRRRIRRQLLERGIRMLENEPVATVADGEIQLRSGPSLPADMVFLAHGVKPPPIFKDSGLPTGPDGGLRVNRFLQCTAYPDIFGGGDCIHFEPRPLDKVGVYAVRENTVLYNNLKAALEGKALQPFDPGGDYLLIYNLGEGRGVLHKRWLTFGGRAAFLAKDFIDRRFMKRFKSLE